jgi:hypothetical protein
MYHLLLQLIIINDDSISNDVMWHAMCQQGVLISNQPHDS